MAGSKQQSAYAVLGLNKAATPEEIKQAYVTLVKKYDPEMHTERFMVVQAAFDKLRDPEKRATEDVNAFNYLKGEFIFNADEQTNAPEAQIEQALKMLEERKAKTPGPNEEIDKKLLQGHMILSWKKAQKKQWAEAISEWQRVLQLDPGHRRAKNNLLHSLISLGHSYATHELYDEAVDVWSQAAAMNPDEVDLLHNLALANEFAGKVNEAARYWGETTKRWKARLMREPDNEYLRNCLVEALREHGERIDELQAAGPPPSGPANASPGPSRPAAHAGSGPAPRAMGGPSGGANPPAPAPVARAGKSIEDFREIVKLKPDDFEARFQVSSMLMKDQKWADAVVELEAMREKWTRNVEVLNLLGWALLNNGKVDDAFMIWRRARTIEPKNFQITESLIKAHMTMGRTMRDKGLYTPCLVHFKALMRYLPDNDEVHFEIARTYQKKGDERSAYQEYQKVLKLNPKHMGARNGLASLKLRR